VRLIVSSLAGGSLAIFERAFPSANLVQLTPMTLDDGDHLLELLLSDARWTLQKWQRSEVLK
jgi:hypothetical protein